MPEAGQEMDVSLIVMTYNQEHFALQALESIRYQMERHGKGFQVQLIVADDGSKDRTVRRVSRWLDRNGSLFAKVNTFFSEKNRGTCRNVGNAIRKAEGKQIFPLAGDDLLFNGNVLERVARLSDNEIVACPCLEFDENGLIEERKHYASFFLPKNYSVPEIRWRSLFSCPIQNGFLVGRDFYSDEALAFAEQFRLLEDRSRYQKSFEIIEEIRYVFSPVPVLLHRMSREQVTNVNSKAHAYIVEDCKKLAAYAMGRTGNPLTKWRIRMEEIRNTDPDRFTRIAKYTYPGGWRDLFGYLRHKKEYLALADRMLMQTQKADVKGYIRYIEHNAREYAI